MTHQQSQPRSSGETADSPSREPWSNFFRDKWRSWRPRSPMSWKSLKRARFC